MTTVSSDMLTSTIRYYTLPCRSHYMPNTVVTCETKLCWNNFEIILLSYYTCNHVWNWNKIISAAERVLKLFRNYLSDIEHVGKYSGAAITLWNNFEILSGKFPLAEIKLSQTDVNEGWSNFEIILFHMWFSIMWLMYYIATANELVGHWARHGSTAYYQTVGTTTRLYAWFWRLRHRLSCTFVFVALCILLWTLLIIIIIYYFSNVKINVA